MCIRDSIHQEIIRLRDEGKAILLVSVELDEVRSLSDRIAVMFDGQLMGERDPAVADERELGLMMAGISEAPDKPDWQAVEENLAAVEHGERPKHG